MEIIRRKGHRLREFNEALRAARAFLEIADTFFAALPGLMKRDPDYARKTRSQLIAAATNLAFGVELYLKTLLMATGSKVPTGRNGHNLLVLFEALTPETRTSLELFYQKRMQASGPLKEVRVYVTSRSNLSDAERVQEEAKLVSGDDLQSVLTSEKDAFQSWRYFYEAANATIALYRIKVRALYAVANAVDDHFNLPKTVASPDADRRG